ncbi:alpha/beta fold hydrolase [Actinocorallia sp. API 0066]|uniref:alpha/beta fold hydrolase n=1 Tax=Actinocorallia sp. API 0066 TaxID=2896846 RepID=UPI001E545639|nr:alpha/beta fold hydrolase [Actinocorallia sp. API 0066]MCD0447624.1 alpha/beta fold hydrolase [Actinocorallia sp. API 0066]
MTRSSLAVGVALLTAVALLPATPAQAAPQQRTVKVRSFDGVRITTHFFRAPGLKKGERRPVVLLGHGWAGRGETKRKEGQLGYLLKAGYNVVTWNARGFGSGGRANVDDPRVEGRDMKRLINWIARQPEVKLDRKGDPRLGMAGGSYGGAIQLVTAGLDRRVDVIVPTIAFHNLVDTLYTDGFFRAGWGLLLCSAGLRGGNKLAWQVEKGCVTGLASGEIPGDVERWFREHGPAHLVKRIKVPTLVLQGTVDTLFTLRQGVATYKQVKANGAPAKMVWFCGGHGACKTNDGPDDHLEKATLAWFARYLKGDRSVDTGPGFEYIDQHGVYRGAPSYPPASAGSLDARGTGALKFSRADVFPYLSQEQEAPSGPLPVPSYVVAAEPAKKAVNVPIPAPSGGAQAVGSPQVTLHYKGTAKKARTALFAQIVDRRSGLVLGNQATPLPVVLDGRPRTVTRELEAIAHTLTPNADLVLQIVPITGLFDWQRSAGSVELEAKISVPLSHPGPRL